MQPMHWIRHVKASLGAVFLVAMLGQGHAQEATGARVALVIGNANYLLRPLDNSRNDANGVANLLSQAGFTVTRELDTSRETLRSAIEKFGERLRDQKVKLAVFFYSGHGIQVDHRNYLIPVDAQYRTMNDIQHQLTDLTDLVRYSENAVDKSFIFILDACRDDPFAGTYLPTDRGLQALAPDGTFMGFATSPGQIAWDGTSKNSLYSGHLIREFGVRSAKVDDVFRRVQLRVQMESKGRQIPWVLNYLKEDVSLFSEGNAKPTEAQRTALYDKQHAAWRSIQFTRDSSLLVRFLIDYPNGVASEKARARLNLLLRESIRKEDVAQREQEATLAREVLKRALEEKAAIDLRARGEEATEQREQTALRVRREEAESALTTAKKALLALEADEGKEQQRLETTARSEQKKAAQALAAIQQRVQRQQIVVSQLNERVEESRLKVLDFEKAAATTAQVREMEVRQTAEAAHSAKNRLGLAQAPVLDATPLSLPPSGRFKGADTLVRNYAAGDSMRVRVTDLLTKVSREEDATVAAVNKDADQVVWDSGKWGTYVWDLMGNLVKNHVGQAETPRQFYPADLAVGKKWQTRFGFKRLDGGLQTFHYDVEIVDREHITVPAGTFYAYKIVAHGRNMNDRGSRTIQRTMWVAPGVNVDVASEVMIRDGTNVSWTSDGGAERVELVHYTPYQTR